ncbi:MAG: hypothetical protein Q9162_000373 [Coniocarpon cinnabarinum]
MKFMQRAQARDSPDAPRSDERPSKRRKTDDPATPSGVESDKSFLPTPTSIDLARDKLLADQAEEAGDTKWTLQESYPSMPQLSQRPQQVISAGYGMIDSGLQTSSDSEAEKDTSSSVNNGRRRYGPAMPEPQEETTSCSSGISSSVSDSELSASNDHIPSHKGKAGITQGGHLQSHNEWGNNTNNTGKYAKENKYRQSRMAAKRTPQEADEAHLDRLSSISGGSAGASRGGKKRSRLPLTTNSKSDSKTREAQFKSLAFGGRSW